MNQRGRYVSTTIVGILAISSAAAVYVATHADPPDAPGHPFLDGAEADLLARQLNTEDIYSRPARDTLHLIDDEARMIRLYGADAVTTGDNGYVFGRSYVWKGLGSATIEGEADFVPRLIGLRLFNPAGPQAPVFFKLQYNLQNGSTVDLGTRKVTGKQVETFVFPAKSAGLHTFQFFYSYADEWVRRQPLEIREVYLAE